MISRGTTLLITAVRGSTGGAGTAQPLCLNGDDGQPGYVLLTY